MINLYHGDCMEAMKLMKDKQYDLAIVDPPYGIGADNFRNGEGSKAQKGHATAPKIKNRALNQSDCSWDLAPTQEYFSELFRVSKNQIICGGNYFDLPPSRGIVCWDKEQPWENFSAWEFLWTSFDEPASIFRYRNNGFADKQDDRIHPTQKPVKLYKWLLTKYAKPNDKILDTHGGSMSIAIACHDLDFDLDLWELDKDYYEAGVKRFEKHKQQLKLAI